MTPKLLESPVSINHKVQFYGRNDASLIHNVAQHLCDGIDTGDAGLAVVRKDHRDDLIEAMSRLGYRPGDIECAEMLFVRDADETLSEILTAGHPNEAKFDSIVGSVARDMLARSPHRRVRIYGEMVGILWSAGRYAAALRLEQLWNRLIKEPGYNLFCGYDIDVLDESFRRDMVGGPLCAHASVVTADHSGSLEAAVFRATAEMLGVGGGAIRREVLKDRRPELASMPQAEATILWLWEHHPDKAGAIISQTRRYLGLR